MHTATKRPSHSMPKTLKSDNVHLAPDPPGSRESGPRHSRTGLSRLNKAFVSICHLFKLNPHVRISVGHTNVIARLQALFPGASAGLPNDASLLGRSPHVEGNLTSLLASDVLPRFLKIRILTWNMHDSLPKVMALLLSLDDYVLLFAVDLTRVTWKNYWDLYPQSKGLQLPMEESQN